MKEIEEILERIHSLEAGISKEKLLLTFNEAQKYLGFSKYHLRRLCYRKKIPHYKPTERTIFFFRQELDAWVAARPCKRKSSSKGSSPSKSKTS